MNLIQESLHRLFPEKEHQYETELEYNRRLADFNANISLRWNKIKIHLNLQWKDIDDEIKIGLIQSLLLRVLKKKKNTPNLELYHNFVRNISLLTPKTLTDPILEASFHRVNESFFEKGMEQPNLKWGKDSFRKLGSYNFHDDSITISTLFASAPPSVLDYLMYHELLHKHFKFENKNGRSSYHSPEFRATERIFPEWKRVESQMSEICRKERKKNSWFWF